MKKSIALLHILLAVRQVLMSHAQIDALNQAEGFCELASFGITTSKIRFDMDNVLSYLKPCIVRGG